MMLLNCFPKLSKMQEANQTMSRTGLRPVGYLYRYCPVGEPAALIAAATLCL
jgi:hypothetical protein